MSNCMNQVGTGAGPRSGAERQQNYSQSRPARFSQIVRKSVEHRSSTIRISSKRVFHANAAAGYRVRAATDAIVSRLHVDHDVDAGPGDRLHHSHLLAHSYGDAQVAAGG